MGGRIRQYDWSDTSIGTPDQWSPSLRTTVSLVLHSAFPMFLFWGKDLICFYNDAFRPSLGSQGKHPALGKPGREVWPEIWDFIGPLIDGVIETGEPVWFENQLIPFFRDSRLENTYWTFSYSPAYNDTGQITGVLVTCLETANALGKHRDMAYSEKRYRTLIEESPVATAVYSTRDLIIETANDAMIKVWGKTQAVVGMKLVDALPELEGQPFVGLLEQVYDTAIPYRTTEQQAKLVVDGRLQAFWFTFTYQPLLNEKGEVYAILNVAIDVTERVMARKKTEEAEASLRGAIELAELATWILDIPAATFHYSQRFMDWLGFSESTKALDEAYNPLPEEYRESVGKAIEAAIAPDSSGIYENEHPIVNRLTGQVRIIHAQAQVFRDTNGNPVQLSGTARDITDQRRVQLALERQVSERTEELAAAIRELQATNEELAALNEEYASINEEYIAMNEDLHESNEMLIRSNTNLERFAYVASHDLQEPLRKVQQFGNLLQTQYADQLGDGAAYLERMQAAALRMSTLIRDLLSFSRILPRQDDLLLVSLNDVVNSVLADLDVLIQETGAVIKVELLPTVLGDPMQLGQLFQNLLSNALKFRQTSALGLAVPPLIRISNKLVTATDLPPSVTPTRTAGAYYRISVSDNGIGFEEKYADRIFQVFQRLHSKSDYAGTGIGLAICEKVVSNHGGAISAHSQLGQGATFNVYLPV